MRLFVLIMYELRHRWLNSILAMITAMFAVAGVMAALVLLHEHRLTTDAIIEKKTQQTQARLATLADDMRKITVRMGFNILILPKDQNLGDFYADDYASQTMPEHYATTLAASGIATINHILPSLQQRMRWQEQHRTVLLIGIEGELHAATTPSNKIKKPLLPRIQPGQAMLGHELHRSLQVKVDDIITLNGQQFKVSECRPEKGNKDDITIWVNLSEAQHLLSLPGRINAILALECNCSTVDRLGEIRADVARILPDTQVLEYESKALARAEARNRAEMEGIAAVAAERENRLRLEQEKERLASTIVPLTLIMCGILIGLFSWQNIRERRMEIAILRTIGLPTGSILCLVLFRAAAIGQVGSIVGVIGGLAAVNWWVDTPMMAIAVKEFITLQWMLPILCAGPLLALVSAWLPALLAAQQDPADILRET